MNASNHRPGTACVALFKVNARLALPPIMLPGRPDRCAIRTDVELRLDREGHHHAYIDMTTATFSGDSRTIDSISIETMITVVQLEATKALQRRRLAAATAPVTIWIPKRIDRVGEGKKTVLVVRKDEWKRRPAR